MKLFRVRCQSAMTRLEVLSVLAVRAFLAAVVLSALAGGKPRSDVAVCANNLRQQVIPGAGLLDAQKSGLAAGLK